MNKLVNIRDITIGDGNPIVLIGGPCAIESAEMAFATAEFLKRVTTKLGIPFVFKASFDKANRMSIGSKRGIGLSEGLEVLYRIREELDLPIITDVHESCQTEKVAHVVDALQIPSFLSRQTDLLLSAAETGKPVNIKKGQFLKPDDMQYLAQKVHSTGNNNVLFTERGTSFGYGDIILDPRSIIEMKSSGYPVVLDVTHTTQKPGANAGTTGGNREYTPYFVKLGVALGVDAIYMEIHPDPNNAISDKECQIPLDNAENILKLIV